MDASKYYELTIKPTGSLLMGFSNINYPLFKIITHPSSSQHIDQLYTYNKQIFNLNKILIVTKRPL